MSDGRLTLRLLNDIREITRMTEAVDRFGAERQISEDDLHNLHLILDETVVNIIKYGFDDTAPHTIEVRLEHQGEQVTIEIEDDGRAFDPTSAPPPDFETPIEERPIGGLGIHIVKSLSDGMRYRRVDGRNVLTIEKKLGESSS